MRPPPTPPDGPPPRKPRPSTSSTPQPPRPSAGGPAEPRPSRAGRASVARPEVKPIALNISLGDEPASDIEKAEAIRDVMQHAATMAHEVALAKEMKSWPVRPITMALLATLALALTTYTFVGQSDWAYGPDPAQVTPARHDAHLKYAMFLVAQRVEAQRATAGTLPATLAELGEEWDGLEYRVTDSTFVLQATAADSTPIVLDSATNVRAFLVGTRRQLREQRR